MKQIVIDDINLLDIGNTIQISGAIWSGNGKHYLCFLPGEFDGDENNIELLAMNLEQWKSFIKQTDLCETQILAKDETGGLVKILIRKTTRQIDSKLQWKVFQRDDYTCRYCGKTGIPLTVDHLVLWEDGGPTIEENLLAACKKCNKTRGSMPYEEWLDCKYYNKVAQNLRATVRLDNEKIADTLDSIERVYHKKSR